MGSIFSDGVFSQSCSSRVGPNPGSAGVRDARLLVVATFGEIVASKIATREPGSDTWPDLGLYGAAGEGSRTLTVSLGNIPLALAVPVGSRSEPSGIASW
jgi:hypothetical protein